MPDIMRKPNRMIFIMNTNELMLKDELNTK